MPSETMENPPSRERIAVYVLSGLVVGAMLIVAYLYFTQAPQMGTSEEVFKTVDALYTAVRSRDENRLQLCEKRLGNHRASGKLPAAAASTLDSIVKQARSGAWQPATERLYAFMLAQRREGVLESNKPDLRTTSKKQGRR